MSFLSSKRTRLPQKRLIKWRTERHPEAGEEVTEAALRAMNPRELQNATLLTGNEEVRPTDNRQQSACDPFAAAWKLSG